MKEMSLRIEVTFDSNETLILYSLLRRSILSLFSVYFFSLFYDIKYELMW